MIGSSPRQPGGNAPAPESPAAVASPFGETVAPLDAEPKTRRMPKAAGLFGMLKACIPSNAGRRYRP